jgi:23S rRNA (adenine2503-C2)-methyltransferase
MESFYDQSRQDLLRWVERPARAARAFHEVYRERRAVSNAALSATLTMDLPSIARRLESADGTRRYLLRLSDDRTVESVFIPGEDRDTFCISSQIGCALGCTFCLTAQMGLIRDLSAGEIVSQVMVLLHDAPRRRFSIVLMGMGEPLANYDSVIKAIDILHDNHGLSVPPARITLSTAGLIPGIERLSREPVFPNLSISLTGVTNAVRDQLMPINRKYPIDAIVDSIRALAPSRQSRVMFECVMIQGVTDSAEDAHELARLLRGLRVKVNLIPLNPGPGIPYERAQRDAVFRYQEILVRSGFATFIRKNRGNDVCGACGQLNSSSVA